MIVKPPMTSASRQWVWNPSASWARSLSRHMIRPLDRAALYVRLADKLDAGHQLRDALEQETFWVEQDSRWDARAVMLRHIIERLDNGEPFDRALEGYAKDTEQLIVSAMAVVSDHAGVLRQAARGLEISEAIKAQYMKLAFVPLTSVPVIVAILVLLAVKLVPMLEASVPAERWPRGASILRAIAGFFVTPWAIVLLVVAMVSFVVAIWSLSRWTGRWRLFLERIPPWATYKAMVGAEWLVMLGAMLSSGQQLVDCLERMRRTAQPWLRERVDAFLALTHGGMKFGAALYRSGYDFPQRDIVRDLASAADLPNFDAILIRVGEQWLQRSQQEIGAKVSRLTGIAVASIYAVVAMVIAGVLSMVGSIVGGAIGQP